MFYIYADGNSIFEPWDENLTIHSPKLTLEMGKAGSLSFQLPPTNKFYNQIQQLRTIVTVELDEVEIFRGRVLTNNRSFNNMRTIYCEGDLSYLVDSVQKGEKFDGMTHDLFKKIINNHNARVNASKQFTVGQIGIENRSIVIAGSSDDIVDLETDNFNYEQIAINSMVDEWETSFDYIESSLIDYCGGYLRTRRVGNTTYIDLVQNYGNTAVQEIEFGVNLLDLTEEVSSEDVFTVLIPLGEDNLTIASVNHGSDELVDETAVSRYGRIVKTHVFDSVNQASTLLENGKRFLANHVNIPITITVKAVDMHLVDKNVKEIYIGDRVHVNSLPHDIADYLTCTKIEYDLENPANNSYTFGTPRQTMTERYRKDRSKSEKTAKQNSGRGGGGAGGASNGAAKKETEEQLSEFFDAWINVDKESANIDLGTLYKKFNEGKEILESTCGISLDAPSGNINIHAFRKEFDDLGKIVSDQSAYIDVLNNEIGARIDMVVEQHKQLADLEKNHYAAITARVDETESEIALNAQAIETQKNNLSQSDANISLLSDQLKAQISLEASHKKEIDGEIFSSNAKIQQVADNLQAQVRLEASHKANLDSSIASLELIAKDHESQINLKADKTTVNSKITTINSDIIELNGKVKNLQAEMAEVDNLIAKRIQSSWSDVGILKVKTLVISGGGSMSGEYIATQKWVSDRKYLTSIPSDLYLSKLQATNIVASSTLKIGLQPVATQYWCTTTQKFATQAWVTSQLAGYSKTSHSHGWSSITGRPSSFSPSSHKHKVDFNSQGVSTNGTHKVTISGKTYSIANGHTHKVSGYTNNN